MIGFYVPGDSLLHRAPVGAKLVVLALGLSAFTVFAGPRAVALTLLAEMVVAAAARLPAPAVLAQLRPLLWILVLVAAVQVWMAGWRAAVVVCGSIVVAVLGAALVTLTTRTDDLIDTLVRALNPLRRWGVHPERVALVLTLAIRAVPVLTGIATEVQQARAARGAQRSVRAFAVPFVIRSVRYADRLGEALVARGVDDL